MACARLSEEASPAVGMVTRRWHCSMSALLRPRSSQPKTMATRLPSWSRGAISRRPVPASAARAASRRAGRGAEGQDVGGERVAERRFDLNGVEQGLALGRGQRPGFFLIPPRGADERQAPAARVGAGAAAMPMFSGNLVPTIMISRCCRASCEACTSILTSGETGWQGRPQAGSPCTDL